jgi:hypothetical protein
VAAALAERENHYSYRILLSGSEESGLRGVRAHIARLWNRPSGSRCARSTPFSSSGDMRSNVEALDMVPS